LLVALDDLSNARLNKFDRASGMKDVELLELSDAFHQLSDALNAGDTARRNKEHQLRPGIRRMTRAFGLLGRRALGSELNTLEWQTLLSIAENPCSYRPTELALYQGVHKSTMAIALAELERRGLIARIADKNDKRATYLSASNAGYRQITSIETRTARRFSAWQSVTTRQVELLERWMRGAASVYHLDDKSLKIETLVDESAITQARHATAAFYLSSPLSLTIPAELFSLRNNLYGLYRAGELVAAAELNKARCPRIVNLCFKDQLPLEALYAFLARAADPTLMTSFEICDEQIGAILKPHRPVVTALGRLFF
jgi:DNA-binding MarR family transcriptional regulator